MARGIISRGGTIEACDCDVSCRGGEVYSAGVEASLGIVRLFGGKVYGADYSIWNPLGTGVLEVTGCEYDRTKVSGTVADIPAHSTDQDGVTIQAACDLALDAYNTTGVAKEASVGAIATVLAGITSVAAWLRGLFRKDAMNAVAKAEVNAIHDGGAAGMFDEATDSGEGIRDSAPMGTAMRGTDDAALAAVCTEERLARLDATVSSRATPLDVTTAHATTDGKVDAAKASADAAKASADAAARPSDVAAAHAVTDGKVDGVAAGVWAVGTRTLTSFGTLVADVAAAVWNRLTSALTTAGSVGKYVVDYLAAIKAKTDTIGAVEATYTTPAVTPGGPWEIHCGSAYLASAGRAVTLTVAGYGGPSLVGAAGVLRLLRRHKWAADEDAAADLEVAATVSVDGTTVTLSADLDGDDTAALKPSPPLDTENYKAQFVVTPAGGEAFVIGEGDLTAKKGIAAAGA